MKKINYTHNDWILSGLLFFSIFGVVYLYCSGVDSWENISNDMIEECAEYHFKRFIDNVAEDYTWERYNAARSTSSYLPSIRKRKETFYYLNLWYGHVFRHVELDLKKALPYYILASKMHGKDADPIKTAEINIEIAYLYHKLGNKKRRDFFLEKSRKLLQYCRNHETIKKDKYLACIEFDYISLRSCILGDEGKFTEALQLFQENKHLEEARFSRHRPLFPRAIIYKKMGDEQAFIKELERLEKTWKVFHLYSYYYLLQYYEKNGDHNKCIAFIESQIKRVRGLEIENFLMMDLIKFYKWTGKKEKAVSLEKKLDHSTSFSEKTLKKKLELFR